MNITIGTLLEFKGTQIYTIPPTATVAEAVLEMNRHNIGSLVVMEGDRMLGMFTARDLMRKVIPAALSPQTTQVVTVMHSEYPLLSPDMGTEEAMEMFEIQHIRHLPVFDQGKLKGVLSIGDLARWCSTANRVEAESLRNYIHTGGLPG